MALGRSEPGKDIFEMVANEVSDDRIFSLPPQTHQL